MTVADVRNLCIGCLALTLAGILLPCMTIIPQAGEYTAFIKMLAPDEFEPTTYSLVGGIFKLMSSNIAIGILLLLFSVIFPLWKIVTYIYYLSRQKKSRSKSMTIALKLGKYSMLDVFVLALLVIAIKGLPGDSKLELEQGIYFFGAAVILSLYIGQRITKVKPLAEKSK